MIFMIVGDQIGNIRVSMDIVLITVVWGVVISEEDRITIRIFRTQLFSTIVRLIHPEAVKLYRCQCKFSAIFEMKMKNCGTGVLLYGSRVGEFKILISRFSNNYINLRLGCVLYSASFTTEKKKMYLLYKYLLYRLNIKVKPKLLQSSAILCIRLTMLIVSDHCLFVSFLFFVVSCYIV